MGKFTAGDDSVEVVVVHKEEEDRINGIECESVGGE